MDGIFVTKTVSVKRFSFFNGGYIRDQERVCQTLQLHDQDQERVCQTLQLKTIGDQERVFKLFQWRERVCIGGGDQERVCQTLSMDCILVIKNVCLSNSSASLMDGIFVIKNVSVKLFSFFNGGCIVIKQ